MVPTVEILRNRVTREILICHYAYDPQYPASVSWGEFVRMTPDEAGQKALSIAVASLAEYPDRDPSLPSEPMRMTKRERTQFDLAHEHVSINSERPGVLKLTPMRRRDGGFIGASEKVIRFDIDKGDEEFYKVLQQAFVICQGTDAQ